MFTTFILLFTYICTIVLFIYFFRYICLINMKSIKLKNKLIINFTVVESLYFIFFFFLFITVDRIFIRNYLFLYWIDKDFYMNLKIMIEDDWTTKKNERHVIFNGKIWYHLHASSELKENNGKIIFHYSCYNNISLFVLLYARSFRRKLE